MHNKSLTKEEKDFLTNYFSITSNFNWLPKIHKSKQIKKKNAAEIQKIRIYRNPKPQWLQI